MSGSRNALNLLLYHYHFGGHKMLFTEDRHESNDLQNKPQKIKLYHNGDHPTLRFQVREYDTRSAIYAFRIQPSFPCSALCYPPVSVSYISVYISNVYNVTILLLCRRSDSCCQSAAMRHCKTQITTCFEITPMRESVFCTLNNSFFLQS